jgi:hypothetical protein
MPEEILSAEMLAVADALRHVRARLSRMMAEDAIPENMFPAVSRVLVDGETLIRALEELAR